MNVIAQPPALKSHSSSTTSALAVPGEVPSSTLHPSAPPRPVRIAPRGLSQASNSAKQGAASTPISCGVPLTGVPPTATVPTAEAAAKAESANATAASASPSQAVSMGGLGKAPAALMVLDVASQAAEQLALRGPSSSMAAGPAASASERTCTAAISVDHVNVLGVHPNQSVLAVSVGRPSSSLPRHLSSSSRQALAPAGRVQAPAAAAEEVSSQDLPLPQKLQQQRTPAPEAAQRSAAAAGTGAACLLSSPQPSHHQTATGVPLAAAAAGQCLFQQPSAVQEPFNQPAEGATAAAAAVRAGQASLPADAAATVPAATADADDADGVPTISAVPVGIEQYTLETGMVLYLTGLEKVASDVWERVPTGSRWKLVVVGLLGKGCWGIIFLVEASKVCAGLPGAAGAGVAAAGGGEEALPGAGVAGGGGDAQASSNSSSSSGPQLMALKVAIPHQLQLIAGVPGLSKVEDCYDLDMRLSYADEANTLAKVSGGEVNDHTICFYEHGEVDLFQWTQPALLMEYAAWGSLASFTAMNYPNGMPPDIARIFVKKTVAALGGFHGAAHAIHRDFKPDNILLTGPPTATVEELQVKTGDVGVCKILHTPLDFGLSFQMGSGYFRAPEGDLLMAGQDLRFDTFAIAGVFLQLRFNKYPFEYLRRLEELGKISRQEFNARWGNRAAELDRPDTPYGKEGVLTEEEKVFLKTCMRTEVSLRPVACNLKYEPYMFRN